MKQEKLPFKTTLFILWTILVIGTIINIMATHEIQMDVCRAITNDLEFYDKCIWLPHKDFIKVVKDKTNDR